MDQDPPSLSFIGIVDFSEHAKWIYMTASVTELLGYEPKELIGRSSLELVHPDEAARTKRLHYDTIKADQAAVVVYLRMKHKVPSKGYILCSISRTVVHNVLVGSVSFASASKAMHNASTAQEVTVLTPGALSLKFGRWHDPPPVNPSVNHPAPRSTPSPPPRTPSSSASNGWRPSRSPISPTNSNPSRSRSISTNSSESGAGHHRNHQEPLQTLYRGDPGSGPSGPFMFPDTDNAPVGHSHGASTAKPFTFAHLPNQSLRTLFILDRFSRQCPIMYCSNDLLVTTLNVMGRSFFDFVAPKDENRVRNWLEQVKSWGVNDRGEPSDGGFGYGGFELLTRGRDSEGRLPDPALSPHKDRRRKDRDRDRDSRDREVDVHASGRRPSVYSTAARDRGHTIQAHGYGVPDGAMAAPSSMSGNGRIQLPPLTGNGLGGSPQIAVDAIFSAHSDGLMVVLRRSVDV